MLFIFALLAPFVLPQAKKTPGDKNGIDTLTHN
jgi:hypothetical protein